MVGIAVILLGAGIWIYKVLYLSTGGALERAEAFRFQRMTVAQMGEQGAFRFFYVTNRSQTSADGPPEERFGRSRAEALKFGSFDTHVEPTLGLGMLINPSEWFQDEEIRIDRVQALDRDDFVFELRDMVEKSPRRSLLVVVHGFREAFPSALRKTAFVGHILDIDSPVLLFDWPGNQGSSPQGYRRARQVAEASGAELAQTLRLVIEEIRPERLWLMANSMGGEVVVQAFSTLYELPEMADAETNAEP